VGRGLIDALSSSDTSFFNLLCQERSQAAIKHAQNFKHNRHKVENPESASQLHGTTSFGNILLGSLVTPHRDFDPHSQEHVQWLAQLAMRKKEEERNSQRKGGKDDREEYGNEFGREFGREFGNEHGREYGTEFGREFGMKPDRDGMSKAEFV